MAGTICSLPPGHSGGCEATCQHCGGDWYMQTCTCLTWCAECGAGFEPDGLRQVCDDCRCQTDRLIAWSPTPGNGPWEQCALADGHERDGWPHQFQRIPSNDDDATKDEGPTDEELAEVFRSLGVDAPNGTFRTGI